MREILFRGMRLDNCNWTIGHLIKYEDGRARICESHTDIFCYEKDESIIQTVAHMVAPSTIGQFTGLTDKNGKKIFEGDVVKAVIVRDLGGGTENREETGIIAYDKIGMIGLVAKYAGTIPVWSDFFQELTLSGCINDFWFEVIGNIHDNPELLENP